MFDWLHALIEQDPAGSDKTASVSLAFKAPDLRPKTGKAELLKQLLMEPR